MRTTRRQWFPRGVAGFWLATPIALMRPFPGLLAQAQPPMKPHPIDDAVSVTSVDANAKAVRGRIVNHTATSGVLNFDPSKFTVDASGLNVDSAGGRFSAQAQANAVVVTFTPFVAPPATPPAFTGILLTNGLIQLTATGVIGQTFHFQATTNLSPPFWLI